MDTEDPLKNYVSRNKISVKSLPHLKGELYHHLLDTVDNRILSQAGRIPDELLHQYADNLLGGVKPDFSYNSNKCVLEVTVHRAENLAPKDVTGTSDPYCLLGLVSSDIFTNLRSKKRAPSYKTTCVQRNLNPVWNQCFEIPIERNKIPELNLHIQIWDRDEDEGISATLGALKDVKGMRGVGRYMKEVAQTVTKKNDPDDFMGFSVEPLKNIPMNGLEKWYTVRSHGSWQGISGRIKISLKLYCPHKLIVETLENSTYRNELNDSRKENYYSNEVLYGGLLTMVVNGRHNAYKVAQIHDDKNVDGWDGKLQEVEEVVLNEFTIQRGLGNFTCRLAKWNVYVSEHVKMIDGIKMIQMTTQLKELEHAYKKKDSSTPKAKEPIAGESEVSQVFTLENVSSVIDQFVQHSYGKIVNHRVVFPVKESDTIIRLGELLICLKTLRHLELYFTARLLDTSMFGSGDINTDITNSLRESVHILYKETCLKLEVLGANIANLDEGDPIEEYNIVGLIKLVDKLKTELIHGDTYYRPVFKKILNIDYIAVILGTIGTKLSEDLNNILKKVNMALCKVEDPRETITVDRSSEMFRLYLTLHDFAEYVKHLQGENENQKHRNDFSMQDMTDGRQEVHTHINALKGYHNWFRPTVLRWLQMSRGRTIQLLSAAVKLDKVERLDDIVKHSSSAVDAIGCLNSHVVRFWLQLKWPDPVDSIVIATRIMEDISHGVEYYADLVEGKLKAVGFFDDEGQFDVTEELCLALNNLEKVKLYLEGVLSNMELDNLAVKIDALEEGPSGEKLMQSFNSLVRNADNGMIKKIQQVMQVVGKKMEPDIKRNLREFSDCIQKKKPVRQGNSPLNGHDSDYALNRKEWEEDATDAISHLMEYLTNNIITLKEWLCEPNFKRLIAVLWKICVESMKEIAFIENSNERRPYFFKQCRYVLTDHLIVFYHADGEGMSLEDMHGLKEYSDLNAELKLRAAKTHDIMRLFFVEMYEDQITQEEEQKYGCLNVYAWYNRKSSELIIDVLSAENLVPQDINGLSDPFVQITLMPKILFSEHRMHQTLVEKKTVNPVFNDESFSYEVDPAFLKLEGIMVVFTVLDHDVIGRNDLEGEAVLPLCILDGADETPGRKRTRNFKLPLTLPKKIAPASPSKGGEVQGAASAASNNQDAWNSPYAILQQRIAFDRDAAEFYRWRKKLVESIDDDKISNTLRKRFSKKS